MIFKKLEITNYGIFKGKHEVSFAQPSIQRVTLVGGLNGSGKTTIFEAIQIALFGARSNLHKENKLLSYNKYLGSKINRDCNEGEGAEIRFTLNLADDIEIDEDITLIRGWKNTTKGIKEYFEVERKNILDVDLSENWIDFISQIISPSLSKLFLFDGEKILKYADPHNTSSLLIQGIQTLFGADLINDLEDDLKILEKRIIKSFDPKFVSDLEDLDKAISVINKKIKMSEINLDKSSDKLELLHNDFDILENKFFAQGLNSLNKVKTKELELEELLKRKLILLKDMRTVIGGSMPLSLIPSHLKAISAISSESTQIKEAEQKVEAFKERDKQILQKIKKSDDGNLYKELKSYLAENIKELNAHKINSTKSDFISSADEHLILNNELKIEITNFKRLQEDLSSTLHKIEQLERYVARKSDDKQDSKKMFAERDLLNSEITLLQSAINDININLDRDNKELVILTNKYKKSFELQVQKLQAGSVQSKQLERIEFTKNILDKFNKEIVARSLDSIENLVTQKFKYLIRKDSLVEEFTISRRGYVLGAKNAKGKDIKLIDLSAGERQILAISILWSLSELSKTNIPVIIDTPLGRLDSKHRNQLITKYFPAAGPQTIILSTDQEIIGEYYKTFKPYIGKEYICSENKKELGTGIIKEGYF